jgi:DNA-directed RNA polymerase alpha subunit
MASKIVETYNALNNDNKKVVQEMINKDKNSFMKFANFASGK